MKDVLDKEIVESLGSTPEAVFEHERLVFTHFMDTTGGDTKFFVEAPDIKKVTESAKALAATTQVTRYCGSSFRPSQIWLGKRGCTTVYKSVLVTF